MIDRRVLTGESSSHSGFVKICGITRPKDAIAAVDAGVDAIGLNLWRLSPRGVSLEHAALLTHIVRGHARTMGRQVDVVAVLVDPTLAFARQVQASLDVDWLQLHGDEPAWMLQALQPFGVAAAGIACDADANALQTMPGAWVLADAHDRIAKGGTGRLAPPRPVAKIIAQRRCMLAGGLRPSNVAEQIARLRPWGVDTASGVEAGTAGVKDAKAMVAFVRAARQAFARMHLASGRLCTPSE